MERLVSRSGRAPGREESGEVIDSWKEIARYLNRDIRTVQRWEASRSLPVRRLPGGSKPGVYALRTELDAWRRRRKIHVAPAGEEPTPSRTAPQAPSVAVLPFRNLSDNKENEYFAAGLADEIITALSRLPGLRVTARTSSFAAKVKDLDIREAGRLLRAGAVLDGSVRRSGNRIRVTAQLLDAREGCHLWGERYDGDLTDLFGIQDRISQAVVEALRVRLVPPPRTTRRPASQEAYHLWLQGRHLCLRQDIGRLARGRECFRRALELDPHFAPAHLGMAEVGWEHTLFGLEEPRKAVASGRQAALRALEIDGTLGDAWAILGVYRGIHDFEWNAAEGEFLRAIDFAPASPMIRVRYAAYHLEPRMRLDEARNQLEIALDLDPLSPVTHAYMGQCFLFRRDYERAIKEYDIAAELDPGYWLAHFLRFGTYAAAGRWDKAVPLAEAALAEKGWNPMIAGALGAAYGAIGRRAEAEGILRRLEEAAEREYLSPLGVAWVHLGLGDIEQCMAWLERAVETREPQIIHLQSKSLYDPLRAHPRFQALLRRMGLERDRGPAMLRPPGSA